MKNLILVLSLAACMEPPTGEPVWGTPEITPFPVCDDTFSPDTEVWEEAHDAAEEWSAATGRNICIQRTGVPIIWQEIEPTEEMPARYCGLAHLFVPGPDLDAVAEWILISPSHATLGCPDLARVVKHEMGHALDRAFDGNPEHIHTHAGLMAPVNNSSTAIDAEALELICRRTPCF